MEIEWVKIGKVKADPKNRNKHSKEQITRLAKIIQYQGWRWPIIVSKQDGLIKAGHGRLLAAKELKLKEVPVSYQDFTTPEQAYSFGISDNAIQSWSELDLSGIHEDIIELGPELDIELLGIGNFQIAPPEEEDEKPKKSKDSKVVQCPNCGEQFNG